MGDAVLPCGWSLVGWLYSTRTECSASPPFEGDIPGKRTGRNPEPPDPLLRPGILRRSRQPAMMVRLAQDALKATVRGIVGTLRGRKMLPRNVGPKAA